MHHSKTPLIVLLFSIVTAVFWCFGQYVNVYRFAAVGAIFELVWLPMIALLFILSILSFVNLIKERFSPKSLYLYSFLVLLATVLFLLLRN
jgi:FlaA1/EpsC-like NDP-sugar epimerase